MASHIRTGSETQRAICSIIRDKVEAESLKLQKKVTEQGGTMKVVIDGKEFEALEYAPLGSYPDTLAIGAKIYGLKPIEKYKWAPRVKLDVEGMSEEEYTKCEAVADLQCVLTEIALSAAMNGEVASRTTEFHTRFAVYYRNDLNKLAMDSWNTATHGVFFKTREFADAVIEHYGERLLKAYRAVYGDVE
jgi:hypothetical protein